VANTYYNTGLVFPSYSPSDFTLPEAGAKAAVSRDSWFSFSANSDTMTSHKYVAGLKCHSNYYNVQ